MTEQLSLERMRYLFDQGSKFSTPSSITPERYAEMRDAIDAEISRRGEAVAWEYRLIDTFTGEWKGWVNCSKEDAEAIRAGKAFTCKYETRELFTAPPAPKPVVDDAAVERLAVYMHHKYYTERGYHGGWNHDDDTIKSHFRDQARAALTAAVEGENRR